jgi:site-specific DNA-cytosine methylase
VFVREDGGPKAMRWMLPTVARYTTVGDVLEDGEPDDPPKYLVPQWEKMLAKLEQNGHPRAEIRHLALTQHGHLHRVLQRTCYPDLDFYQLKELFTARGAFSTRLPRFLPPDGIAPTLMSDSMWLYRGRLVANNEYKALMGFPREYVFPPRDLGELRKYLSKGVCPPVAAWVLRTLVSHLARDERSTRGLLLQPGDTANFNVTRKAVWQAA